jgi:predicted nucleotidyltransferase
MHEMIDKTAHGTAARFANRIVPVWQAVLGPELLGVYLVGSLAHGGFSRRYSDIDIAVITEAGLPTGALDHVRGEVTALSADLGPRLSVFWTDRHFSLGRFPPLDRIDYLDHARTLIEHRRVRPTRPSREEIRRYLVPLISRALECRQADADPDPLFPARASLPSQVDACMALLSGPVSAA